MALSAGDALAGTGLAGALYSAFDTEFEIPRRAVRPVQRMCDMLAGVIVTYFKANGDVHITVADGGLQRVAGVDTDPPGGTKVLSGAID